MKFKSRYVSICKNCRLCGSTDLTEILSFGETPLANAYLSSPDIGKQEIFAPLILIVCNSCKLVQLRDVVDPSVLFSHYLYVSGTSPVFAKHFEDYANTVVNKFSLPKNSFVVDIGSNDGVLLSYFKKEDMKILGIDPAQNLADEAIKNGIPTLAEFFTVETARNIAEKYGKSSVITANNVFAHTDNVVGFVEAVKLLLEKDGVFIFEVQYLKDLIAQNLFDIIYHEHLCYYHLTPLAPFFERQGLRIVDVDHVSTHGGSIRAYVAWADGPHKTSSRVQYMQEKESALNDVATYQDLARRIAANKEELREMLAGLKRQGKRVVGYGAPAKATTLCYAFGLDNSTIEYIVDDSPLKQGLYMPGTHIPIKSSDALYNDKPDYCIILAWNFADSIVKNHQQFVKNGGTFINPSPEPHLIH